MNNEIQEQVNNLSMIEQNMQQLAAQRQSFQGQLIEAESALEEIKVTSETYKIIGSIMVKMSPSKLIEELDEKKKLLEIRIKSIEKQEDLIKEKSKKMQEEILSRIDSAKQENKKEENPNHIKTNKKKSDD
ncbi:MAG: prefoldin subunit beta [Candidatus Woesearchaeota archaeon]|jgi:prefoldin beta subunit